MTNESVSNGSNGNQNEKDASLWREDSTRPAGYRQTLKIGDAEYGFCWIPAGEFDMGSPESERGRWFDEVLHHVTLTRGFWMLETPTTQAPYVAVMSVYEWGRDVNPSYYKGRNLPVEQTTWYAATKFCRILTGLFLPEGVKATLPTEAQWEYACRAGTKTAYWYGDSPDADMTDCYEWMGKPVGRYAANPWGLYDMLGGVGEWVLDWYGDYPSGSATDPIGPSRGDHRVSRGAVRSHSASRGHYQEATYDGKLGFRFILYCD